MFGAQWWTNPGGYNRNVPDTTPEPLVEAARKKFEVLQSRMNAAKVAHLNGTPLDGHDVAYEDLKKIAEATIDANYELQRARYGSVRLKLSVAKLLRRGR
jgi:hypothetical protein